MAVFPRILAFAGSARRASLNRKFLAVAVDAVRKAGFAKPRVEGEANGEWIIVDCGQAVVHIMQPNIRQYYHLEDLWGDKPVRLKFGADKPVAKAPAKTSAEAKPTTLKRSSAAKKGVTEVFPSKAQEKKAAAKKAAAKPAAKAPAKKSAAGKSAGTTKVAAKTTAKTSAKTGSTKAPAKKTAARKA